MSDYFLIQSRDPFEGRRAASCFELAVDLARNGSDVVVYLVENGVLPARAGADGALQPLRDAGITLLADDFSLRERGIDVQRIAAGVEPSPISSVIDALAAGAKTVWH